MLIPGRARDGQTRIEGEQLTLVYDELRQVASRLMRRERSDHTLSPTAVVHEAVLRLMGDVNFAAVGSEFSFRRRSAGDALRGARSITRGGGGYDMGGGGWRRVPIDAVVDYSESQNLDIVAVHEAARQAGRWLMNVVESGSSRSGILGGMTVPEVARAARRFGGDSWSGD